MIHFVRSKAWEQNAHSESSVISFEFSVNVVVKEKTGSRAGWMDSWISYLNENKWVLKYGLQLSNILNTWPISYITIHIKALSVRVE